jgi:hypothetical protein
MELKPRVLEQHIAVFGESGSGKTVLVSCFYGAMLQPEFTKPSLFNVTADDVGKGSQLYKNYLGMRDSARRPEGTRFSSTPYAFSVKLKNKGGGAKSPKLFEAVRLVWHDYPGEWWQADPSVPEEAQRRVDTFKSLLGSDVAFLLVDGQKVLDNAGEEERYLKSLLGDFKTGLLTLKDQLLEDAKPLVKFPRIWILALSKADLLPELDVYGFRDLVIGKANDDLDALREALAEFVDSPDALAVGEDFVRFSSAKFEPNRIEVTERIGLDLVLPLAAMLPFERHIKWVEQKQAGEKVAEELLKTAPALAAALLSKAAFAGPIGRLVALVGVRVLNAVKVASNLGVDQLRTMNRDALAKHDYMAAVLTRFGLDLDDGEDQGVLLRSTK